MKIANVINKIAYIPTVSIPGAAYAKQVTGLLVLLALLTYDGQDPSPLNLLTSGEGISNILGLPGALLAGLLFEFLGYTSFAIPILINFTSSNGLRFSLNQFFPLMIELLSLASLYALISRVSENELLIHSGIWGAASKQTLIEFPGLVVSLVVLIAYQLMFFKSRKLDLTPFILFGAIGTIVLELFKGTRIKSSSLAAKLMKYGLINWLTPISNKMSKYSESLMTTGKSTFGFVSEKTQAIQLHTAKKWQSGFKRDVRINSDSHSHGKSASLYVDESELLSLTIKYYKQKYFEKDKRSFLIHEEEI